MSLDPRFVTAPSLQSYFVDKKTGAPLSGGQVFFYSDVNREIPKTVYQLTGTPPNYIYEPLPNPLTLSNVGTPQYQDVDLIIYYYPLDTLGNPELYYIIVQDQFEAEQFVRQAWPNPEEAINPGGIDNIYNYIPNGQFLLHTNLPNNELVSGFNITAQGGFGMLMSDPLTSLNTYQFVANNYSEDPSSSPRWFGQLTAMASGSDTVKNFRTYFNDVNKFSSNNDIYTFAFWANVDVAVPISIEIFKYFGTDGSVVPAETVATGQLVPGGAIYQFQFSFGLNTGLIVDTVNNNDFVAIDIALPTNISFVFLHTDFVLAHGAVNITGFPLQTNGDMVSRGNLGWTDISDHNGYDLYLPIIQTRYGFEYDFSQIGKIEKTVLAVPSPLSDDAVTNNMPIDGAVYPFDGYSKIGIPFARLGNALVANSTIANTPMFGTGLNFATAYVNNGDLDIFRLTVNANGVGVSYAADGLVTTGFTFTGIPTYDGSITGSATLNYFSFSNGQGGILSNQLICKANFQADYPDSPNNYVVDGAIPTGFTFEAINYDTGTYAQQAIAFNIHTLSATDLIQGVGSNGAWFYFYSAPQQQNPIVFWFSIDGEIPPTASLPSGAILVEIKLNTTDTAPDVAYVLREIMCAFQSTYIDITTVPAPGSYFTFQTNPGSIQNYLVWYSDETGGDMPVVPGYISINAPILSTDSHAVIVTKTLIAINQYQYAILDAPGMFFRNSDPNGIWDTDNLTRFSNVTGMTGPAVGTFEFSQLFSHYHFLFDDVNSDDTLLPPGDSDNRLYAVNHGTYGDASDGYYMAGVGSGPPSMGISSPSGGLETRPSNAYANYYIKY